MRTARIFLSSTFLDFAWEREVINTVILPALNEELRAEGVQIDLIDLRWGVPDEAGLDHSAVDICLREVRRCAESGVRPAFVLLIGDRPGWQPLPRVITRVDFDALRQMLARADPEAHEALNAWYQLDRNFTPESYRLRSRRGTAEADPVAWGAVERTLQRGVDACLPEMSLELAAILTTPITRMETEAALRLSPTGAEILAALHRVGGADAGGATLTEGWRSLAVRFADRMTVLTGSEGDPVPYRAAFRVWARDVLLQGALSRPHPEVRADLAGPVAAATVARDCEVEIAAWLDDGQAGVRLIHGASGSGKSVLSRRLASGRPEALQLRLSGEGGRLDQAGFLDALAERLGLGALGALSPSDALDRLRESLSTAIPGGLLVVDALEQVAWRDPSEALAWLPLSPANGCKILLTTASQAMRDAASAMFGPQGVLALEEMSDGESRAQYDLYLARRGRTLQPDQREALVAATDGVAGRALVNRIAASIAETIEAETALTDLPQDFDAWLAAWISHLVDTQGHGAPLVTEALALIAASRRTVLERDLYAILNRSAAVRDWVRAAFPHGVPIDGLPRTSFSRLIGDMESLLVRSVLGGEAHYGFAHTRMREGVKSALGNDRLAAAHDGLARVCLQEIGAPFDASLASAHRLAEVLHHLIGADQVGPMVALLGDPEFLTAKTSADQLSDTMEDARLLSGWAGRGADIVREAAVFLKQERRWLADLPDSAERRAFVQQRIEALLASNALRRAVAPQGDRLLRARFPQPSLPGFVAIDPEIPIRLSLVAAHADEVAIAQKDGSIVVVGGDHGELRRRLPGHVSGSDGGMHIAGVRHGEGRLLTCGRDGQVALSSIGAGRDLKRFTADGGALSNLGVSPSGSVTASSYDDQQIYRWSPDGELTGRIATGGGKHRVLALTGTGLEPAVAEETPRYLPFRTARDDDAMPAFRAIFRVLDDDTVVTGDIGQLAVWSFARSGPRLLLNQAMHQDYLAKFVLPAAEGVTLVTNTGGVVRLAFDGSDRTVVQASGAGGRGGADRIDPERLFCWALRDETRIDAALLDWETGEVLWRGILDPGRSNDLEYFRGGGSNVRRGLIAMDDWILAWAGYGCERIDLKDEAIRPIARWRDDQYAVSAGKISDRQILILRAGRPVVMDAIQGEVTHDFTSLTGTMSDITPLGDGRFLVSADSAGAHYWNVADSVAWYDGHSAAALGGFPRDADDVRFLAGGHLSLQQRMETELGMARQEFWDLPASGDPRLVGHHNVAQVAQRRGLGEVGYTPLGPLLVSWSGPPPRITIQAAPAETIFRLGLEDDETIKQVAPLVADDGRPVFPVSILLAWGGTRLNVVAPELGLAWPLASPDGLEIVHLTAVDCDLVLATRGAVWKVIFPNRLPRDPVFTCMVDVAAMSQPGRVWEVADILHRPDEEMGWVLVRGRPEKAVDGKSDAEAPRAMAVIAYDFETGPLDRVDLPEAIDWTLTPGGFEVRFANDQRRQVRWDASTRRFADADAEAGALKIIARTDRPDRPHDHQTRPRPLRPQSGGTFETTANGVRLIFEPSRIRAEAGERSDVHFEMGGYSVIEVDTDRGRVAYQTAGRMLQVLDVGPMGQDGASLLLKDRIEAGPDLDLARLLRRCGRPDMALSAAARWFNDSVKAGPASRGVLPDILLEFADAAASLADIERCQRALGDFEAITARDVPELGAPFTVARSQQHQFVQLRLALLAGDASRIGQLIKTAPSKNAAARMCVNAALTLVRREPARLARLRQVTDRLAALFADAEAGDLGEALRDLHFLIRLAQPSDPAALTPEDWYRRIGEADRPTLTQALAGDADACLQLGAAFGAGRGVVRSPGSAAYWYEKALAGGSAMAAFNLSQMIRHGEIAPRDENDALIYMRAAAQGGLTVAKCNLGVSLMQDGDGGADLVEARDWLEQAAAEGDTIAPMNLAVMLSTGAGGPPDLDRAKALLAPMVRAGDLRAAQLLNAIETGQIKPQRPRG